MKTLIATIATVLMTVSSASALSFTWASSTAIKFDGTNLKSSSAVTGYLVYLGSSATVGSSYDLSDSIVSTVGTEVGSLNGTSAMSKISTTFTFDYGTYENNDAFAMLLKYDGADGKTYYNLSSTTYTLAGIADEKSTITGASFAFSYGTSDSTSKISSGGGWTAVPEPSTAALALAGRALLLKRRKA